MLNPQIRRNLQQNQLTQKPTVRPELFLAQADLAPQAAEPQDVFVPRDPTVEQPAAPNSQITAQA